MGEYVSRNVYCCISTTRITHKLVIWCLPDDCDDFAIRVPSLMYAYCGGSNMHDVYLGTFVLHLNAQIYFLAWYLGAYYSLMIVIISGLTFMFVLPTLVAIPSLEI